MELSIVIPALNEARKIARDVYAAAGFLADSGIAGEIIVVDDGSADDTAQQAALAELAPGVERRVIRLPRNLGKGAAVRAGIVESRGDFVLFADCGLCVPFEQCTRGMDMIKGGQCEIAHGSRKLPTSVIVRPQAIRRRLLSRLFRTVCRAMVELPPGLTDTQCGFKIYAGEVARTLYAQCRVEGFMFDIETLVRAKLLGYRLAEFPVTWTCDRDSRLKAPRTAIRTIRELRAIRKMMRHEAGGVNDVQNMIHPLDH